MNESTIYQLVTGLLLPFAGTVGGWAAGVFLPPVALDSDVYVIYRRKPVKAKVIFIGINADRLFFFNVLRGNIKANFQTYQFTENDIGRSVFLTLKEAEKAVA